jgi:transcriptional regulator with XRE-family HTH domain
MTESEKKAYLQAFGKRVRLYREQLGMSQRELGAKAGYVDGTNPAASISKIENGQMDITQTKCADLAKALHIEPYELLIDAQTARLVSYAKQMMKGGNDVDL